MPPWGSSGGAWCWPTSAATRSTCPAWNWVEGCYFAFHERQRDIGHATSCDCNACRLIPDLSLTFVVHHGQYALHEVAGHRELVGREVIVAHRLLKNHVSEDTGLRGYALFSP